MRGGSKAVYAGQGDLFVAAGDVDPPPGGTIDQLMNNARRQAEGYAALLPADHVSPPFLLVCDVGRSIEVFADFSGYGRHYHQFPDARSFRLSLPQLADSATRDFLRAVWLDPGGRDLTSRPRGVKVIDLFGLSAREVRDRFPEVYQHLLETVKPERDANNSRGIQGRLVGFRRATS